MNYDNNEIYRYSITMCPPEEDKYYLKEELDYSEDNSTSKIKFIKKIEAINLMYDVGKQIGFPYYTLSSAINFFHRFYEQNLITDFPDTWEIGLTCLLVASKAEETVKKLKEIITTAYRIKFHFNEPLTEEINQDIDNIRKRIVGDTEFNKKKTNLVPQHSKFPSITYERLVLQAIGFNFKVQHPQPYIIKFSKMLKLNKEVAEMAWKFLISSFKITLCIQYPPNVIALTCILLTIKVISKNTTFINIDSWEEFFFIKKETLLSAFLEFLENLKQMGENELINTDLIKKIHEDIHKQFGDELNRKNNYNQMNNNNDYNYRRSSPYSKYDNNSKKNKRDYHDDYDDNISSYKRGYRKNRSRSRSWSYNRRGMNSRSRSNSRGRNRTRNRTRSRTRSRSRLNYNNRNNKCRSHSRSRSRSKSQSRSNLRNKTYINNNNNSYLNNNNSNNSNSNNANSNNNNNNNYYESIANNNNNRSRNRERYDNNLSRSKSRGRNRSRSRNRYRSRSRSRSRGRSKMKTRSRSRSWSSGRSDSRTPRSPIHKSRSRNKK